MGEYTRLVTLWRHRRQETVQWGCSSVGRELTWQAPGLTPASHQWGVWGKPVITVFRKWDRRTRSSSSSLTIVNSSVCYMRPCLKATQPITQQGHALVSFLSIFFFNCPQVSTLLVTLPELTLLPSWRLPISSTWTLSLQEDVDLFQYSFPQLY